MLLLHQSSFNYNWISEQSWLIAPIALSVQICIVQMCISCLDNLSFICYIAMQIFWWMLMNLISYYCLTFGDIFEYHIFWMTAKSYRRQFSLFFVLRNLIQNKSWNTLFANKWETTAVKYANFSLSVDEYTKKFPNWWEEHITWFNIHNYVNHVTNYDTQWDSFYGLFIHRIF